MLRPDQPIPDCTDTLDDLAREADSLGLPLVARLYDHIATLQTRINAMPDAKAIAEIQNDAYWHGYEDGKGAP